MSHSELLLGNIFIDKKTLGNGLKLIDFEIEDEIVLDESKFIF